MKRKILFSLIFATIMMTVLTACINNINVTSKNPVTLTLWHNYGGQLKETMDEMIDEFNETIGAENGIIISVTSISGSSTLHDKLTMAANGDPGAPSLPDITTLYPKTALILFDKGLLADLNQYFTSQELSAYIPEFLQEGKINNDGLYVFPTAKSTEVLFVNKTLFERFAKATGAKIQDLQTIEGIMKTADLYYQWTDQLTPDVENDGKMFFISDSLFNFSLIGCQQLGEDLMNEGKLHFDSPSYFRIWESYFKPAVLGQTAIFDGYATDLAKTGDILCSTGSTAGVSFFSPTVTYADNTSDLVELVVLPYPIFEGGKKIAIQRGAGMGVIKSTKEKEDAASIFLKWFTSPENNLRFVSSTGYLPVTKEAFGELMSKEIDNVSNDSIKKLLQASKVMQDEYSFYIPPLFDGIDEFQKQYESHFKRIALESRELYLDLLKNNTPETAYEMVVNRSYESFISSFQ